MKEKMTIHEFIQYTKENPLKFISYCEIVLDNLGYVYLAIPSHQEKLIELYCDRYHMTRDDFMTSDFIVSDLCMPIEWIISKENFINIYYDTIVHGNKINRLQKRSIDILMKSGLVHQNVKIIITDEYQRYLFRKESGGL